MKSLVSALFFLIFSNILFGGEKDVITAEFPEYVVTGSSYDVQLFPVGSVDSVKFNGNYYIIDKSGSEGTIHVPIKSKNDFHFEKGISITEKPKVIPGWMSILPPLIAIGLALIIKEVLLSLFIGIFTGAAIIGFYTGGFSGIFSAFFAVIDTYIIQALADSDHLSVILFSVIIGAIVAVISKNGGMQGVVNKIVRYAHNRKSGMITTYVLGVAIFFDDYANTLVVGNTMRSVTDRLRISREKLAYLVDSTAAPVAAIAFVTTWIGAELGYISSGIDNINATEPGAIMEGPYSIFVNSLSYSFYPIFTLFFMYFIVSKNRDFGPMRRFEKNAIENGVDGGSDDDESTVDLKEFDPIPGAKTKAFNAVIPIVTVVAGTIIGLIYTGLRSWKEKLVEEGINIKSGVWAAMENYSTNPPHATFQKIGAIIGDANSYEALLWASVTGLFVAILLTVSQGIMKIHRTMETVLVGIKTMMPAILILVLAWSLAQLTHDLGTADYFKSLFGEDFKHVWVVPAITFILSSVIAFSTGSSWSTMALIYPIMIPTAYSVCMDAGADAMPILYNTVASVLAGAVLGDHCSPISDTTILSSLASSCNHINHVKTQMPYALTVGGIALFIGVIPGALGVSSLITIPVGIGVAWLVVHFVGKRNEA